MAPKAIQLDIFRMSIPMRGFDHAADCEQKGKITNRVLSFVERVINNVHI